MMIGARKRLGFAINAGKRCRMFFVAHRATCYHGFRGRARRVIARQSPIALAQTKLRAAIANRHALPVTKIRRVDGALKTLAAMGAKEMDVAAIDDALPIFGLGLQEFGAENHADENGMPGRHTDGAGRGAPRVVVI